MWRRAFCASVATLAVAAAAHAQAPPIEFSKTFSPDQVAPDEPSVLTFLIENNSSVTADNLDFTDNLPAGLTLTSRTPAITCTGGTLTAVSGSGVISYSGGSVAAGSSCTILVEVSGPTSGVYVNTSGSLTSSIGSAAGATDTLVINVPPSFSKSFSPGLILVGGISTLTLTIDNTASSLAATGLAFVDALPADLVEIAATPNAATTCAGGTLTAAAGTETIAYSGGSVSGTSSCTVTVDVTSSTSGVIADVTGTHTNTAGPLTSSAGDSGTASADLIIADSIPPPSPPLFSKSFSPDVISTSGTSILQFTIDNSANVSDATSLDFVDNLPAGLQLTARSPAVTCSGGTLTAVAGTSQVAYTGGTAPALTACVLSVEVTSDTPGTHVNTSASLTSSLGDSGTATATLAVGGIPGFSKAFAPGTIATNEISTLTLIIDNTGGGTDVGSLVLSDPLPSGVEIAGAPNASTTCSGGSLVAMPAGSSIDYTGGTVAAGSSCTVSVDVTSASAGSFDNTATLSSSAGDSPDASDTLVVAAPVPLLGPWGLLILVLVLLLVSARMLRGAPVAESR